MKATWKNALKLSFLLLLGFSCNNEEDLTGPTNTFTAPFSEVEIQAMIETAGLEQARLAKTPLFLRAITNDEIIQGDLSLQQFEDETNQVTLIDGDLSLLDGRTTRTLVGISTGTQFWIFIQLSDGERLFITGDNLASDGTFTGTIIFGNSSESGAVSAEIQEIIQREDPEGDTNNESSVGLKYDLLKTTVRQTDNFLTFTYDFVQPVTLPEPGDRVKIENGEPVDNISEKLVLISYIDVPNFSNPDNPPLDLICEESFEGDGSFNTFVLGNPLELDFQEFGLIFPTSFTNPNFFEGEANVFQNRLVVTFPIDKAILESFDFLTFAFSLEASLSDSFVFPSDADCTLITSTPEGRQASAKKGSLIEKIIRK